MKIEQLLTNDWVITRGGQYLSFFVDHDKSCWSKHLGRAQRFMTLAVANSALEEIRKRARIKRAERNGRVQSDT